MVTFKVDAQALVLGSEEQEKHPLVAKVKGTGKDGGLSIQVSGEGAGPISARGTSSRSKPSSKNKPAALLDASRS